MTSDGIVIVGGGLAGQRCAETLRRQGYAGSLRMVCAEEHLPYDRPPLSKHVLTGEHPLHSLPFRPAGWYEEHEVDLLLGVRALELSVAERRLDLSDGSVLSPDRLLIATGGRPQMLPPLERYANVSALRSVEDSTLLRQVLGLRPRLAVIGAGFIGQEVAATARRLGAEVTMIEAAPAPLAGMLGTELGGWFAQLHRSEGVDVITGATVERISANDAVRALHLSNQQTVCIDHVVVGIGIRPDIRWLRGSGVAAAGSVRVDVNGSTGIEGVFAAGDAAATFEPLSGRHVAGSHWEAAGRQGRRAAKLMLGLDPGPVSSTGFWTDQYGIRIQYVGCAALADACTVDGDMQERNFTATFTRAGRPIAVLLAGRPSGLPAARTLIDQGGIT